MSPHRAPATTPTETAHPWSVLSGLWVTTLLLSLLGAAEIDAFVVHDPSLAARPLVVALVRHLQSWSNAIDARAVRDRIEALSAGQPGLVWLRRPPRDSVSEPVAFGPPPAPAPSERASAFEPGSASHRILVIGESSIQLHLGIELERFFRSFYRDVEVKRFGKLATSLVRPDVFDWYEKTASLLDEFRPDLVIANFGGNDAQNVVAGTGRILKFGTPEWDADYGERITRLAALVRSRRADLAMIGMPVMRDARFSRKMKHLNAIVDKQTNLLGGTYLSCWDFSTDHDAYRVSVTVAGVTGLMRDPDGTHYSRLGARYAAERLAERLERRFFFQPKDAAMAVAVRRDVSSKALGGPASYLAYVPQEGVAGSERYPVLFLLHGTGGSWVDWPEHAHRELQRLSSRHRLIVVTPDGGAGGWYVDSPIVANSRYETHIMSEVRGDVDRSLPASKSLGIAGLSAGGHGAITLAIKHPGVFASVSSMSGVVDSTAARTRPTLIERLGTYERANALWEQNSARHLVASRPERARLTRMLITVGADDPWATENDAFHRQLSELGVEHTFEMADGQHDWSYWMRELPRHVAWHAERLHQARDGAQPSRPH